MNIVVKNFKDPNKNFWLGRLLPLVKNAPENGTRFKVYKMGNTTFRLRNSQKTMTDFYKKLASRKASIFPEMLDIPTPVVSRSAPLRKTEKSKTCYMCRKLKPNRMFYQRKDGTYFSGCIPCQKTIRAKTKANQGG